MEEIWKDVKGYEGIYQVSTFGRVKSFKWNKKRVLKQNIDRLGYSRVKLYKELTSKIKTVHSLVASAFVDNVENKPEVNHIDGDKRNNDFDNLEWVTRVENIRHAYSKGLIKKGEHNGKSKLNEKQALEIKRLLSKGLYPKEIALKYNVARSTISEISRGKNWGWVLLADYK